MPMEFTPEVFQTMTELQIELSRVLLRANSTRMEAGIAAFACIRCARELLDKYPDPARLALLDVVVAFLRHEQVEIEGQRVKVFQ